MSDNVVITPGVGVTVASDEVSGAQYQRVKVAHGVDGSATDVSTASPIPAQLRDSDGTDIALSGKLGSITETAPSTDTASSGLNGRLQRVAQRLTSMIGLLPTALGANGGLKIEGVASGTVVPVSFTASATNIGKAEDVASADADVGVPAMAVRKATPANTSGTDGDYEMLQMSAGRVWTSSDITLGGTAVDGNSGNKSAQTLRVVLATDQLALATWGLGATGAAVPSGAQYNGLNAATALPTAATAGNLTGAMGDKYGRQVNLLGTVRDLIGTQTTTISASTSETTIVTAAASVFNDLAMLIISNTSSATNTRIDFRDTTAGSVLFSLQSNGGQPPIGFSIPGMPVPQTSVNTNWTAQCSASTTDIRAYAVFAKNR